MEPLSLAFDKLKAFAKSSQELVDGLFHRREKKASCNPIEILKRLQRETFSDLMKLRDRQDKVERVLSFYKPSNGVGTHLKGQVDILGALVIMDNLNEQNLETIGRAGIRTGVESRFTFETTIRQNDALLVEFASGQKGNGSYSPGNQLSLAKVMYKANVTDWLSAVGIPMGAQCRDIEHASHSSSLQGEGLTDVSTFGPPFLNLRNGSAVGITVQKLNFVASLAQFFSGYGMTSDSVPAGICSGTFGKVVYQFLSGTKLSLLGLHEMPLFSNQYVSLGTITIPILTSKLHEVPEGIQASVSPFRANRRVLKGSVALMLETEVDGVSKIGGWIEMDKSNPKLLQWAVTMSDVFEDSFGWGMSVSGITGDSIDRDHFQAESYMKLTLGDRCCLKPGFAYIASGGSRIAALMLRSNWSL